MNRRVFFWVAAGALGVAFMASATTRYVDLNNAAPAPPFTSWAIAATNIQDAVDAAVDGDKIVVTNGVYATGGRAVYGTRTNRVAINKTLTVRSVNGPLLTIIEGSVGDTNNGDGAIRCVYVGTNAVLSGFTLTNGNTPEVGVLNNEEMGAGAWCELSGVVTNCTLNNNSAIWGGGAHGGTFDNCTFSANSAIQGAGAYDCRLNNCTLISNSASAFGTGGGAVSSTLNNCILSGNLALFGDGGGASSCTLNNCTLSGNSTSSDSGIGESSGNGGGAVSSTLNNCVLSGNSAYSGGGTYSSTLNNCILSGNSARSGGAAYSSKLNNCTLSGNSAYGGGGAYSSTLNNCIVYYNSAIDGPNYDSSCMFSDSCSTPLPPGPGNISSEPLLASSSHLSAQSPCIGRGSSLYSSGVDIDGDDWLDPPCMGADQLVTSQATGALAVAMTAVYTNVAVGFVAAFVAEISGRLTTSVWDFGDGLVVSNHPYASHAWAVPGSYLVRLTGYNDSWPTGVSATVLVQVAAREVYYVNESNAAPVYPYTNWLSAANNIQDAIDAGQQTGRLVLVTDGVYGTGGRAVYGQMTNRVVVLQGVEVRSMNGPLLTVIEGSGVGGTYNGDGAIRCVYIGTHAVLSGFTLTNGHTRVPPDGFIDNEHMGGGAGSELSGVLSNCTLSGNSAFSGGGAHGGTLNNCTLSGNSGEVGGGAVGCALNNCVLSGNSAQIGGGASDCTLTNCTLSDNSARINGGGASRCKLNNCTLSGNSANGNLSPFASASGGGAFQSMLNNCIVYYNSGTNAPNYDSSCIFNYSCTTPLPPGPGNLINAPLFVNTNAWSNLRLQTKSPCINAGNNASVTSSTDLDGNPRIVGGTVDIGAYEFQTPSSVISYAWLQQSGFLTDGSADYADPDADGMNNWQEWIAGTDPTNANSVLKMLAPLYSTSGVEVSWLSVPDRNYSILRSTNFAMPVFSPLATNIPGQTNTTTYVDTNSPGSAPIFYRVSVQQ